MQTKNRDLKLCFSSAEMRDLIFQLEYLLFGQNYQVHIGGVLLGQCDSINSCINALKVTFSISYEPQIEDTTLETVLSEIDSGFGYRGDSGAGFQLSATEEESLGQLTKQYKNFLSNYISTNSEFYRYKNDEGIPGYPVFWDYRFIIHNRNAESIFLYASSSD